MCCKVRAVERFAWNGPSDEVERQLRLVSRLVITNRVGGECRLSMHCEDAKTAFEPVGIATLSHVGTLSAVQAPWQGMGHGTVLSRIPLSLVDYLESGENAPQHMAGDNCLASESSRPYRQHAIWLLEQSHHLRQTRLSGFGCSCSRIICARITRAGP